jgi:hypothetical protein
LGRKGLDGLHQDSGAPSDDDRRRCANAAGFFALTGNWAGWFDSPESRPANAPSAGGSFLDWVGVIMTAPTEPLNQGERGRQFGFGFDVETRRNRSGLTARRGA